MQKTHRYLCCLAKIAFNKYHLGIIKCHHRNFPPFRMSKYAGLAMVINSVNADYIADVLWEADSIGQCIRQFISNLMLLSYIIQQIVNWVHVPTDTCILVNCHPVPGGGHKVWKKFPKFSRLFQSNKLTFT